MNRTYRWQFHFNAMHNMTPEKEEGRHAHSFLVILCMEIDRMDLQQQNECEKELRKYLEQYNGKYLNDMPVFSGKIPSIEVIGETLYAHTGEIAARHGMRQIQIEVGDSPVAMFAIGEKLLVSSTYQEVTEEELQAYRRKMGI